MGSQDQVPGANCGLEIQFQLLMLDRAVQLLQPFETLPPPLSFSRSLSGYIAPDKFLFLGNKALLGFIIFLLPFKTVSPLLQVMGKIPSISFYASEREFPNVG